MDWIAWAQKVRPLIVKASESLNDADISKAPSLCSVLCGDDRIVQAGTRVNWYGTVKKAAVTLRDQPANWPDRAPNLWEDLAYRDGIRIIPQVITPGLAFSVGERGWWEGLLYKSLISSNVYTPDTCPSAWEQI